MHPDDAATIASIGRALLEMGVPLPVVNADLNAAWMEAFVELTWEGPQDTESLDPLGGGTHLPGREVLQRAG